MKHVLYIVSTGLIVAFITFVGMVNIVHAETYITEGFLGEDTIWTIEGSPYVLTDVVTVPENSILKIEPGVQVVADPESEYQPYIYVSGTFDARGTLKEPIIIRDIWGIMVDHGSARLEYTELYMQSELAFIGSSGVISSSTISNRAGEVVVDGVYIKNSEVDIEASSIKGNQNGIVVQDKPPIFQARVDYFEGHLPYGNEIGGLGNALDGALVSIRGSSIVDNQGYAIKNTTENVVDARNNWWGNQNAPDTIMGLVEYDPWLEYDPTVILESEACCSSVLFLPGLEATRLYRREPRTIGSGAVVNRLWEPNRTADVRALYLTAAGSSTDPTIYVGEPVDTALGLVDVYDSFMEYLDQLTSSGVIKSWKSFGYDWRKPIAEVVAGRTAQATTTESLIETVEHLAAASKTGKVSLVAHSNGGLVAKYLVKVLTDMNRVDLIDKVISVAVPQIGTPQALLALLHGYKQSLGYGIIAKASAMRELGKNMASAYSLLPTQEYFSRWIGPTIAFASTTVSSLNNGVYPKQLNSYDEQSSFILDAKSARPTLPSESADLSIPIEGNRVLLRAADVFHNIVSGFSWPSTIARWAIVGWGNRTPKTLSYSEKKTCGPIATSCTTKPAFTVSTTIAGDGTVVAPSAGYEADTIVLVDLNERSRVEHSDIDHADIMESSATQEIIGDIISDNSTEEIDGILGVDIVDRNFDYSSLGESTFLVLSTHSPVELHAYDAAGNHTGLISPPTSVGGDPVEQDLYTFYETKIPGSDFEIYGEGSEAETYISFPDNPDNGGQSYSVVIDGIGVGEFTYRVERVRGGEVLNRVEYSAIPVTPLTTASTTVRTQSTASSTQPLQVDIDGNGSTDMTTFPGQVTDRRIHKEAFKKALAGFIAAQIRPKGLIQRIRTRLEHISRDDRNKIAAALQAAIARF